MPKGKGTKSIAQNRKARHDYFIEDAIECGIILAGTEVKSLRAGRANLRDCFARVRNGEVFVVGMHISPYEQGNIFNHDPLRERKLLLHKSQIKKLQELTMQDGMSLIPVSLYFKNGLVKVQLGIARGKKNYDKRQTIAERDVKRDMARTQRNFNR